MRRGLVTTVLAVPRRAGTTAVTRSPQCKEGRARQRRAPLLVSVPILLGLLAPGPAVAQPSGPPPGRPLYLALGNSIAVGVGASDPARTGYVPRLYDRLREQPCRLLDPRGCASLALQNLAVPGATSADLINEQLPAAKAALRARNEDRNPRNDVEVVTIDVGGNDVFNTLAISCPGPECLVQVRDSLEAFERNFSTILSKLRAAAGRDTRIVSMTYYNPLLNCNLPNVAALVLLVDAALEGFRLPGGPEIPGLNDRIRLVSAANDVAVAETYGRLAADDLVGDCRHPDDSGHRRIPEAFAEALRRAQQRAG